MTIRPNSGARLGQLPFVASDMAIVADGSVAIDGSSLPNDANLGDCLWVTSGDVWLVGLEFFGCRDDGISVNVTASLPVATITDCHVHDVNDRAILVYTPNMAIGPGNEIAYNGGDGIALRGTQADNFTITGNLIHDNGGAGIRSVDNDTFTSGGLIELNQIWGNAAVGIGFRNNTTAHVIRHNTIAANAVGISIGTVGCTGYDVRNNALVGSITGYGIDADAASFADVDYNLFFGNAQGPCRNCPAQPNSVFADPVFVNAAGGDWRLQETSPAIDAGALLGVDVNGPAAGEFNSTAPDIGALEGI